MRIAVSPSRWSWKQRSVLSQYLASRVVSDLADTLSGFAIVYLALVLHGAVVAALVVSVAFLPMALLSLPLGRLVDRVERFHLLSRVELVRAGLAMLLLLGLGASQASPTLFLLLAFLNGACETLNRLVSRAIVPALASKAALASVNGFLIGSQSLTRVAALGVAALMPSLPQQTALIVVSVLGFVVAAGLVRSVTRHPDTQPLGAGEPGARARQPHSSDLRSLLQVRWFRKGAFYLCAMSALAFPATTLLPTLSIRFDGTVAVSAYALLVLAQSVGIAGASFTARDLFDRLGRWMLPAGLALLGGGLLITGFAPHVLVAMAGLTAAAAGAPMAFIPVYTRMQRDLPAQWQGTAFGFVQTATAALAPFAGFLAAQLPARMNDVGPVFALLGLTIGGLAALAASARHDD